MLAATPQWCNVVQIDASWGGMQKTYTLQEDRAQVRLSVSLSPDQHRELNEIARKNRVSVAWVVREAVERLLKEDLPLLHVGKK